MRAPNTLSPGAKPETNEPTAATSPAKSQPRIGLRGPVMPKARRITRPNPGGTRALRKRASPALTDAARTLTSNSLGLDRVWVRPRSE